MSNKKELKIQTKIGTYWVSIWWDKVDKAYLVKALNLPGVVTFGISMSDAKRMAKDAIELYGDCLLDEGKIIVDDERRVFGKLPQSRILTPAA